MNRIETLERRLRIVRRYAFTDDRAGPLIARIKAQAKPYWDKREDTRRAAADQRFLFRTS